jgi:hypothetical protein
MARIQTPTNNSRRVSWQGRVRRFFIPAAAVVIVGLAGAALAGGDPLLDLVRGKPAPQPVGEILSRWDGPIGQAPGALVKRPEIIADRARGVFAVRTSAGPLALWSAPTSRNQDVFGKFCWEAGFIDDAGRYLQPLSISTCDPPKAPPFYALVSSTYRSVIAPGQYEEPGRYLGFTIGQAPDEVSTVRLEFTEGRQEEVPVYSTFFFGEIPCGWVLERIVGLNPQGDVSGRVTHAFDGDPSDTIRPRPPCQQ